MPKSEASQTEVPQSKNTTDQPTSKERMSEAERTNIKLRRRELARKWREETAKKKREEPDEQTVLKNKAAELRMSIDDYKAQVDAEKALVAD